MYIIELIIKKFFSRKGGYIKPKTPEEEESERCDHVFMPIDSTGEILACNKCGAVVHKNRLSNFLFKNVENEVNQEVGDEHVDS